jgi:hypothetical protein
MTELVLEDKDQADETPHIGPVMLTPSLGPDYWSYRVRLSDKQAIVGFPKFFTIGIGFAVEDEDWNANLPYTCGTEKIYNHIKHNKGDDSISREDCLSAIRMIQEAIVAARAEPTPFPAEQDGHPS